VAACQPAKFDQSPTPVQPPVSPPAVSLSSAAPTFAQTQVDEFARLFGLAPLSPDGLDELRVWSEEYVFGNTKGIIVTPERITVHEVQDAAPGKPRRHGVRETPQPSPVFGEMNYLSGLNGVEWFCPAADGGALFVEGLHNGKRFTFSAINAHVCEAGKMKRLNQALALIGELPKPR
jgi:hypothetical protein